MTFEEIDEFIKDTLSLTNEDNIDLVKAERLAPQFLRARAVLIQEQCQLEFKKNTAEGVLSLVTKDCLLKAEGKTVGEREAIAYSAGSYLEAKKEKDDLNSQISYLKSMADVMHNFHIFYRNLGRTVNGF